MILQKQRDDVHPKTKEFYGYHYHLTENSDSSQIGKLHPTIITLDIYISLHIQDRYKNGPLIRRPFSFPIISQVRIHPSKYH